MLSTQVYLDKVQLTDFKAENSFKKFKASLLLHLKAIIFITLGILCFFLTLCFINNLKTFKFKSAFKYYPLINHTVDDAKLLQSNGF